MVGWAGNALWLLWHHTHWWQFTIQSMGNRGKNVNTATVDVVVLSGSTLTDHHDRIFVGDGSDK
jgi:hypothetical protein